MADDPVDACARDKGKRPLKMTSIIRWIVSAPVNSPVAEKSGNNLQNADVKKSD